MKKRLIKAVVYYLAIQLIYLGLNFIFNKPFLNIISIEQLLVADASLNDLHYQLQAKNNSKSTELSGKVILVNTGSLSKDTFRLALANTIKKINSFSPDIIGIDQQFSLDTSKHGTTDLQKVINETQGILLAKNSDNEPLLDFGSSVRYGDVSFPEDQYTIRRYSSDTNTFAYIVSKHISDNGIKKLPNNNFVIHYLTTNTGYFTKDSNDFLFYQIDTTQRFSKFLLLEAKDILQEDSATIQMLRKIAPGRATLLGHLGDTQLSNILNDSEDRHPVPCDTILVNREKTMSGILIHANAIENIINPGIRFHYWSNSWVFTILKHLFFLFFIYYLLFANLGKAINLMMIFISYPLMYLVIYLMTKNIYLEMGLTLLQLLIMEELIETLDSFYGLLLKSISKLKKVIPIFILLLISISGSSQDIYLLVKKGSSIISDRVVRPGTLEVISKKDSVIISPSSLVLVKKNNSIIELKNSKEYSYKDLQILFETNQSFSSNFINVISNQDYHTKRQSGVTTRGMSKVDVWQYSPLDSVRILSDSILVAVGSNESKLITDINLYKIGSSDTIKLSANTNEHMIACPPQGEYIWEYRIQNGLEIKKFKNYFIVPEKKYKDSLYTDYINFKKSLKSFSMDMQNHLLKEYYFNNKIWLKD
jgi:hypothetical protein